jgi:hypothetical protein
VGYFAELKTPSGEVIRIENEGMAYWRAWPGDGGQAHAWMSHFEGAISAKNPDVAMLTKMCSIAEKLGARVRGEGGETYPDAMDIARSVDDYGRRARAPWWKRLFG